MTIKNNLLLIIISLSCFNCKNFSSKNISGQFGTVQILKLDMHLDAFGVESAGFPTISAWIDFTADTGSCEISYYEPWLKEKKYSFSKEQIGIIKMLLKNSSLTKLKEEYTENVSDQPTSTVTIYTTGDTLKIKDYGLLAEYPLSDLYDIVYDLKTNFR